MASPKKTTTNFYYGCHWPKEGTELEIVMACIKRGGEFEENGVKCGAKLNKLYERMREIIWPELDSHRWHVLCRDTILESSVTVLLGCGSSGKTHEASWLYLCQYFCFPNELCLLVSSTDLRGLRLRVWGEISSLWERAVQRFDFLPGNMLDSKIAITTDALDDSGDINDRTVRDFRKGIIGVPTIHGGRFVGLGKFLGIKQKKVRLIADEAQCMSSSFLSAFSNLNKNEDFRAIVLGNPNDPFDSLGRAAEPLDGWDNHMDPGKTSVWKTRFMNGKCVNLIGTDSPNFDYPADQPDRYKYLIGRKKIAETLSFFAKDSFEYLSQCEGCMKISTLSKRVLTRKLCEDGGAFDQDVNWEGSDRTKICFVDAAYGTGDRCVFAMGEFGNVVGGKLKLFLHPPKIVPIVARSGSEEPEYQIAHWVRRECEILNIPPQNMFHDSTGRGSLGTALARVWSAMTNPVESGGVPSDRPVSLDHFIYDSKLHIRRLQLCSELYVKKVTEFWYSFRIAVEAGQIMGLDSDTAEEFFMRQFKITKNGKKELETKEDTKVRIGRSPDLSDAACGVLEGARQRGFQITKLANQEEINKRENSWISDRIERESKLLKSKQLVFS